MSVSAVILMVRQKQRVFICKCHAVMGISSKITIEVSSPFVSEGDVGWVDTGLPEDEIR
jgi:hypothetical protein